MEPVTLLSYGFQLIASGFPYAVIARRSRSDPGRDTSEEVAPWIATASPRNDEKETEVINRKQYQLLTLPSFTRSVVAPI